MLMDMDSRESTLVFQSTYADQFVSKIITMLNLFNIFQDYSYSLQTLYWIDNDANSIFSSSFDGIGQKVHLVFDMIGAEDLAVDWIHNIIYWTDSKKVAISACSTGNFSYVHI